MRRRVATRWVRQDRRCRARAQEGVPGVLQLAGHKCPGQRGARFRSVGPAELLATDQHVARHRSINPRDDPARVTQECQADALFVAELHRAGLTMLGPKIATESR